MNACNNTSSTQQSTNTDNPSACVISDVISLYCHKIVLDPKNRTQNSHEFHNFLERFSAKVDIMRGRLSFCIRLVGTILKIDNFSRNTDSDGNIDDKASYDDSHDINKDVNVAPLSEYKPDEWEELMDDFQWLRNRIIDGESNVEATSRFFFVKQSKNIVDEKQSFKLNVKERKNGPASELSSMDMFTKIFDDIMNFGMFLHALSFLELTETNDDLPISHSNAQAFHDFIMKRVPNDKGYKNILLSLFIPATKENKAEYKKCKNEKSGSMLSRQEIMRILNERIDLSLDRFRKKAHSLLQNWYLVSVPIPYMVNLGYGGKIDYEEYGSGSQRAMSVNSGDIDQLVTIAANRLTNSMSTTDAPMSLSQLESGGLRVQSLTHTLTTGEKRRIACTNAVTGRENGETHDDAKGSSKVLCIRESRAVSTPPSHSIKLKCWSENKAEYDDIAGVKTKRGKGDNRRINSTAVGESLEFTFGYKDDEDREHAKRMTLIKIPLTKPLTEVRSRSTAPINISPREKKFSVPRKKFSMEEKSAIKNGVKIFGVGHWKEIKNYYNVVLEDRNPGQIKDCYRNMTKRESDL